MSEIRSLTRKEQPEWYLNFLYKKKEEINREIETTKMELKLERKIKNE